MGGNLIRNVTLQFVSYLVSQKEVTIIERNIVSQQAYSDPGTVRNKPERKGNYYIIFAIQVHAQLHMYRYLFY